MADLQHRLEQAERMLARYQAAYGAQDDPGLERDALREDEERLRLALEISQLATWDWNIASGDVTWNDRHFRLQGYGVGEVAPSFEAWVARIHPDDRAETLLRLEAARERGETFMHEFRLLLPDGGVRWCSSRGRFFYDRNGETTRMIGVTLDVTARRQATERLAASEARLRLALNAGRMAAFEWPLSEAEPPLTDELREQLGIAGGAGSSLAERRARYHPADAGLASATRERALQGDERFVDFEFRYVRPDGRMRWLQVRSEVLRDDEGRPDRLVGVQLDITEQRENEDRLRLLMHEVDHRARNLLFIVQSMVSLTKASDLAAYRDVLLGRVEALARAHQLLAESRWSGADLGRLAGEELRPYGFGESDRIRLIGPAVALTPAQAQALGLCLHELATNAVKYGALSGSEGRLTLEWRQIGGVIEIDWIEAGGPQVDAPQRKGFGSALLARSLLPLNGSVTIDWAKSGVSARLSLPVDAHAGSLLS